MIAEIYQFNDEVIHVSERPLNPLTHKDGEFDYLLKALAEECGELVEGHREQDVVKMADAILDLCYFSIGGLRRMGISEEDARACFLAIHNANMTKKRGAQAKRGGFEDDAIKPTDFVPPDAAIAHILLKL